MHRSPSSIHEAELVQRLLAAAETETVPRGSRERVAQRLGVRARAHLPSDAARPSTESPAAAPTKAGIWSKVALLGVVGGLCVGGWALLHSARVPPPLMIASPLDRPSSAALSVGANEHALPSLPSEERTRSTPQQRDVDAARAPIRAELATRGKERAARPQREVSPPAAPRARGQAAPGLLAEVQALDRVRRALHRGEAALALVSLDDYTRQFPRGELALEGAVLGVQALLASARSDEARALARRALAEPGSERYRPELERVLAEAH
jgi:hypothetical protein